MPVLSEQLRALGIKLGASELPPPRPHHPYAIEHVLSGQAIDTRCGQAWAVQTRYPPDQPHGCGSLRIDTPLDSIARWADEPRLSTTPLSTWTFLDTETTGLAGGSGVYAFMVGVGGYEADHSFWLTQFFMRDPAQEPALLAALSDLLRPRQVLVTFNGRGFDVPLLNTRYVVNGGQLPSNHSPLSELMHLDLLPLARRLWRDRLPSRSLHSLEENILHLPRTQEDVPGWMIPDMYFDYLRSGDARPLKSVFYHNAMDILSMAALLGHMAHKMSGPLNDTLLDDDAHCLDLMALGKLYESMGDAPMAEQVYRAGLERHLPDPFYVETAQRLSALYKHQGRMEQAAALWEQLAQHEPPVADATTLRHRVEACIELAKLYEHHRRESAPAIRWTQMALTLIEHPAWPAFERNLRRSELEHRLNRLQRRTVPAQNSKAQAPR